jgi:hypothetical protein
MNNCQRMFNFMVYVRIVIAKAEAWASGTATLSNCYCYLSTRDLSELT